MIDRERLAQDLEQEAVEVVDALMDKPSEEYASWAADAEVRMATVVIAALTIRWLRFGLDGVFRTPEFVVRFNELVKETGETDCRRDTTAKFYAPLPPDPADAWKGIE